MAATLMEREAPPRTGSLPDPAAPAGWGDDPRPPAVEAADVADPVAALAIAAATLAALAGVAWHELPGQVAHDALDALELMDRRLAGLRPQVLNVIEGHGLWALDGSRTFPAWLRGRTSSTAAVASRQVREARALRDSLPRTQQALVAGRIGADHAGVRVREATRSTELRAQLSDSEVGEELLVAQAQLMDAGTFTRLVRSWAIAADPAGADRAWREADAREELMVSPTLGGFHVNGWLDELSGHVVTKALTAHAGRKSVGDDRTPAQRRAAALVALAHQSLDAGVQGASARVRPHVTVTTSLETLRALVRSAGSAVPPRGRDDLHRPPGASFDVPAEAALTALGGPRDPQQGTGAGGASDVASVPFDPSPRARGWVASWRPGGDHIISATTDDDLLRGAEPATLEDGSPIAPTMLARLVCESQLSRVVFGAESTILDVGREKRIFPANQARAVIARDRYCQFPGCHEPPGFGEIHHSLWWAQHHGPTDTEHGVLLCWHHHDWVHARQITITRSNGLWSFTDRHGRLINNRSPAVDAVDDRP